MFCRATASIQVTGSPSFQPSNLSYSAKNNLICYARYSDVMITEPKGEAIKLPNARCQVYQAAFVTFNDIDILVVASSSGVQFWSTTGDNMLFFCSVSTLIMDGSNLSNDDQFMRGIGSNNQFIFVGACTGDVLVFGAADNSSKFTTDVTFTLVHQLNNFSSYRVPVMCVAGSRSLVASGYENGDINSYDPQSAFEVGFRHTGAGFPCTVIDVLDDIIYAGYSSGHIRIFRSSICEMAVEITAHVRSVTGMVLVPKSDFFVTCAEDHHVKVWSIARFHSRASCNVDLLFSDVITNRWCTGVVVCSDHKIYVSSYDDDNIAVFLPATLS